MSAPTGARTLTDDDDAAALADELVHAAQTGVAIPLISARNPSMTVEDAYAVQRIWAERREAAGRTVAGRKIGLTSKVMQDATGITEPDYGVIFDDQIVPSGAELPWDRWSNVRVEVELAFELSDDLTGPDCTREDVLAATASVIPALEILDAHVEMKGRTIVDTISDNAALGAMVLSKERFTLDQLTGAGVDLRWIGALLSRNGTIEESGVSGAVLGDPVLGVAWLANKLAAHGQGLSAGEIILAGSFTRPLWIEHGDEIRCEYQGLGEITCRFV
jgi:2-oxo-hept-3-ene-1,7-dioate hydratase